MATTSPKAQPTGTCRFEEKKLLCQTFKFGASNNLSHALAKTESENNRRAAQGTVTELRTVAH